MILKGFIGTVYVRIDETSRIDLWRSETWLTPEEVVNEMIEKKLDILEQLAANSEVFNEYDTEANEDDPGKMIFFDLFEKMIVDVRSGLDRMTFDDSYEDVEITISPQRIHAPQLPENWILLIEINIDSFSEGDAVAGTFLFKSFEDAEKALQSHIDSEIESLNLSPDEIHRCRLVNPVARSGEGNERRLLWHSGYLNIRCRVYHQEYS